MGFWGSFFGGSNPALNKAINKSGQMSDFATGKGQNLLSGASDWLSGLMSGDTAKTAKLLAPQIAGQQKQAQQAKQTASQFGNRSGGTNARAQTIDDTTRGNIGNMIAQLTSSAVQGAGSMGQSLFDTGANLMNMQVGFSQQQMDNWNNSILGKGMTTGISAAETYALSGMGGGSSSG
jgi:hypothetical protein